MFAFPTLKEKKEKGARFLRDLDIAIDFFMEKKWIVINGHKEYGKTTLLKWLFKSYYERKKFPVFLDPKKVPLSADGEKLNSFVEDSYINYYENIQREEIATKNPEELICLIDNLDLIQLDDKNAREFLKYLINKFAVVVVTRNMDLNIVNPINYVEMNSFLEEKFTALSIRPVSSSSKERLVNKWLMIDDENRGIDQVVFEGKRRDKYVQIQTVMQKNFFNKTPLDLLLVLSYLDQDDVVRIDYSKYSYIYEALIVTKLNQIADKDANTISVYKTILQQLAYHLYNEGKNEWVDEQYLMNIIFKYKESYSNLKLKAQEVVNRLVDYRFLENIGDEYCFKYSYMYYYFVANYISTKLSPEEKTNVIKDVFNNLVDDMNYNVALFLLHSMNKEYDIIPIIRNQNKSLLSEFEKFRYDDLSKLIIQWGGDIEEEVRKIYTVPENKNIPELRKRKLDNRDEIDAMEEKSGKQHPSNDELRQINKEVLQIVRLVDLAGNLLKNYSGELNNNCREEIIDIMICSVTKVIGAFCKFSMLAVYKIIDMVLERIRNGDEEDIEAQNSFTMFIKKLFADIWSHYVSLNIKYLARSLECDILRDNIDSYVSENPCEFSKMVRLEYIFRISQKLPVNDIYMLFKGKNKLKSISQSILKNSIYGYLSSYQYDYKDKQRICSTLGFNIRDVLIEEQKNSEMNKL